MIEQDWTYHRIECVMCRQELEDQRRRDGDGNAVRGIAYALALSTVLFSIVVLTVAAVRAWHS